MKEWTVYKHTSPSGKVYIGITSQSVEERWRKGNGYKTQVFYKAIEKYGWNNIKHEILYKNLTKEEAEEKEIYLISFYKSNDKKFGYNVENGGNSVGKLSEETKIKISKSLKGKPNNISEEGRKRIGEATRKRQLGKPRSPESVRKTAEKQRGRKMSDEQKQHLREKFTGRKLTPEWLEHRTKAQTGLKRSKETCERISKAVGRKVICLNTLEVFPSMTLAAKYAGLTQPSKISMCCSGKREVAGRHPVTGEFLRWARYSEYIEESGECCG